MTSAGVGHATYREWAEASTSATRRGTLRYTWHSGRDSLDAPIACHRTQEIQAFLSLPFHDTNRIAHCANTVWADFGHPRGQGRGPEPRTRVLPSATGNVNGRLTVG